MGKGQTRWKRWNNPKRVNKTKCMEKMKEIKMLDCCPAIGGHAPIWRPTSIDPIISILHPLLFHLHCCWPFILLLERINHEPGYLPAFVWSLFTFPPFDVEVAVRFSVALNEKQLKWPATGKWSQSIASSGGRLFVAADRSGFDLNWNLARITVIHFMKTARPPINLGTAPFWPPSNTESE